MSLWSWAAYMFVIAVYGFGLVATWRLNYYRCQARRYDDKAAEGSDA